MVMHTWATGLTMRRQQQASEVANFWANQKGAARNAGAYLEFQNRKSNEIAMGV